MKELGRVLRCCRCGSSKRQHGDGVLTSPACGVLPACSTESMALAGVDGSKTNLEWAEIKGILLRSGKRSDEYLETV